VAQLVSSIFIVDSPFAISLVYNNSVNVQIEILLVDATSNNELQRNILPQLSHYVTVKFIDVTVPFMVKIEAHFRTSVDNDATGYANLDSAILHPHAAGT